MHNYKNLKIWQKGLDLAEVIYKETKTFPDDEKYGMTSQLRRASVSISSNIAEGSSRKSKKEFYHFLSISLGSSYEVGTQTELCRRTELLNKTSVEKTQNQLDEIEKMIIGYMKTLL